MSEENYKPPVRALDESKTVLVHGTSIEATVYLLETGIFEYEIKNKKDRYQDFLFFAPNGRYFKENNLEVDADLCTWKESVFKAEVYAKGLADVHYIQSKAGFMPEYISELCEGWNWEILKLLLPEFKEHGFNKDDLRKLLKETIPRKGVILGFNEKILEKKIEKGIDEPNKEVCIYLPQGIGIEYISGIQPIGLIEWDILRKIKKTA